MALVFVSLGHLSMRMLVVDQLHHRSTARTTTNLLVWSRSIRSGHSNKQQQQYFVVVMRLQAARYTTHWAGMVPLLSRWWGSAAAQECFPKTSSPVRCCCCCCCRHPGQPAISWLVGGSCSAAERWMQVCWVEEEGQKNDRGGCFFLVFSCPRLRCTLCGGVW